MGMEVDGVVTAEVADEAEAVEADAEAAEEAAETPPPAEEGEIIKEENTKQVNRQATITQ